LESLTTRRISCIVQVQLRCNSMIDTFFHPAVVQAMALLDECADDMETARMFVRARLSEKDPEDLVAWAEVLEALRVNRKNQA
jgi:hypothetical protein